MKNNFLIIGYGSSGRRYARILDKLYFKKDIYIISKQKHSFKKITFNNNLKKIKFKMILICSETHRHYHDLKKISKLNYRTNILVEKPLFHKLINFNDSKKNIYVGYNLRFDPMIDYIKKKLINKKVQYINLSCLTYLPNWRKNIDYQNSYSANINKGGGVTNDLSHELDLANYLVGIKKVKFTYKNKISNLNIKADDFSIFFGSSKDKAPIIINLGFFFQIEKRQIFLKTINESFLISFDERKIIK